MSVCLGSKSTVSVYIPPLLPNLTSPLHYPRFIPGPIVPQKRAGLWGIYTKYGTSYHKARHTQKSYSSSILEARSMKDDFGKMSSRQCTSEAGGMRCPSSFFCFLELQFLTHSPHPPSSKPAAQYLQMSLCHHCIPFSVCSFIPPSCFSFIHFCDNTGGPAKKYKKISHLKSLNISLSAEPFPAV